ncbi:MAG: class I SAM-dependent methyltransferase [Elusimicrobia bacterium]|nr:class I SAM-dependent methyltransferase [Elusimicrobiota bacterium]
MSGPKDPSLEPLSSWERLYHLLDPEKLPWNAGRPDPELVKLVEAGIAPKGRALDVGTGAGHDAVYLASKGFKVTAVDIAPAAIKLAQERASGAGVEESFEFWTGNVLDADWPAGRFSFINDRGFFHYLRGSERSVYVSLLARLLAQGGLILLRVFSDKEPPCLGPLRYSQDELKAALDDVFSFEGLKESVFEGPAKAKSLIALLKKRPSP